MPHKPEAAILSYSIQQLLPLQEIFKPYLGKHISLSIESEEGKVYQITIAEEKEVNQKR